MAKKPNLTNMAPGKYDPARLNENLNRIAEAFENTLSRDGSTPNAMNADLDMNERDVLNIGTLSARDIKINGEDITAPIYEASKWAAVALEAAEEAEEYAEEALIASQEAVVLVNELKSPVDRTFRVPEDYPTIQAALDSTAYLRPNEGAEFEIRISSGHALTAGFNLPNGEQYGHYRITSDDTVVSLASGFTGTIFQGTGATFPKLDTLIDATNQVSGNAFSGMGNSWFVNPTKGIRNSYAQGSFQNGGNISANGADFTGASRNGNDGAAFMSWGGIASFQGGIADNSGYYGVQSAHGSVLNAREAKARNASRYGFRASDGAILNLDGADGSGAGTIGIYGFNGTVVNAPYSKSTGCGSHNVAATNGSLMNARNGDFKSSLGNGGYFVGAFVDVTQADFSGAAGDFGVYSGGAFVKAGGANARKGATDSFNDFVVSSGGLINLDATSLGGVSQEPNLVTPSGIIFDPRNVYSVNTVTRSSNWNDANMFVATRSFARIEPLSATRGITGLAGGYEGKEFTIFNVSTTQSLRLTSESTASLEANRFGFKASEDLLPGGSALLKYIGGRWRLLAVTSGAPKSPAIPNVTAGTENATTNAILAALRTAGIIAS